MLIRSPEERSCWMPPHKVHWPRLVSIGQAPRNTLHAIWCFVFPWSKMVQDGAKKAAMRCALDCLLDTDAALRGSSDCGYRSHSHAETFTHALPLPRIVAICPSLAKKHWASSNLSHGRWRRTFCTAPKESRQSCPALGARGET